MSGITSRLLLSAAVLALCLNTNSVHAQTPAAPAAAAPATPTQLWRSDSAVVEAEKMISTGKYVDALTLLDQALARNLHNIEAHVHSGLVWYYLGNNEKARASIKSAQMIDQNHIGSYVILGMIALKEQRIDDASDYLGIIRMMCRGETCPEYQSLLRMIREAPTVERKPWYHF